MKGEVANELRSLQLFLCMDKLGHDFEIGLEAHFDKEEMDDILNLYWHLRDEVKDIIRTTAVGHRLATEAANKDKS